MATSPATPPPLALDPAVSVASTPSNESSIESLSFDFEIDSAGNYIRHSRGSSAGNARSIKSANSSPPTPQDDLLDDRFYHKPSQQSPLPTSASVHPLVPRRGSLSRSESAYPVLMNTSVSSNVDAGGASAATSGPGVAVLGGRTIQRVSSGPVRPSLPRRNVSKLSEEGVSRPRLLSRDRPDIPKTQTSAIKPTEIGTVRARMQESIRRQALDEKEKENRAAAARSQTQLEHEGDDPELQLQQEEQISRHQVPSKPTSMTRAASYSSVPSSTASSRPLAELPLPQRTRLTNPLPPSSRSARALIKTSKYTALPRRITEAESEPESIPEDGESTQSCIPEEPSPALRRKRTYGSNSPNETAVAVDALSKSGTRPRRSASLSDALNEPGMLKSSANASNMPTNGSSKSSRPGSALELNNSTNTNGEVTASGRGIPEESERTKRKEPSLPPIVRKSPSPTHLAGSAASRLLPPKTHQRRDSDTLRSANGGGGVSFPSSSPTAIEAVPGRLSPAARAAATTSARHRRSPTAPEPSSSSGTRKPDAPKTWSPDSASESEAPSSAEKDRAVVRQKDRDRERGAANALRNGPSPSVQPQYSMEQVQFFLAQQQQQQNANIKTDKTSNTIMINKKPFVRLDLIGKGGSSRVFRVLSPANELFAVKRVSLDKTDSETMQGYMNEIALLKRLEGNSRIIRLVESEVKPGGTPSSKGHLLLMMECGEVDMAKLLTDQQKEPLNMVWVAYYWQQMLQAVQVIHDEKIVHSDLKPANFVLVRGQLKLIDFGIANAIANDTTNIQRDHQIGTVNYMSPEAIELTDGNRRLKVGRPSDVWSLGCILYQMIYGNPPFHHLTMYQKMKNIPDPKHNIVYHEYAVRPAPPPKNPEEDEEKKEPLPPVKKRVRRDVIDTIQRCLRRLPKERASIPELLELDWLQMTGPDGPPDIHELLGKDETVINPHFMLQLLQHGMRLGQSGREVDLEAESIRLVSELKAVAASQ